MPTGLTFTIGEPPSEDNPLPTKPSADQDPIFDHANGTKTDVTTAEDVLTPPAGCRYVRVSANVDILVRTDGQDAADDAFSILVSAGQPEIVPVTEAVPVSALSTSGTAVVRCMPFKSR